MVPAFLAAGALGGSAGAGLAGAGAGLGAGAAGTAISAAGSSLDAFGSLGLGIASLIAQKRANYQARLDQQAYLDWLSPSNQMMLRRMAGLNPYGDFQAANGNYNPVNTAAGIGDIYAGMQNSLHVGSDRIFSAIANRIQLKQLRLEEKKLDLDTKRVENETNLAAGHVSKLHSETVYQDLLNWITENTKGYQVSTVRENLYRLAEEVKNLTVRNQYLPEQLSQEIENLKKDLLVKDSTINLNKAQRNKLIAEVNRISHEIKLIDAQTQNSKAQTKYTIDKNQREGDFMYNVQLPKGYEEFLQTFYDNDARKAVQDMLNSDNPGQRALGNLMYAFYYMGQFMPIKGILKSR